jgi:hypothetical protein
MEEMSVASGRYAYARTSPHHNDARGNAAGESPLHRISHYLRGYGFAEDDAHS